MYHRPFGLVLLSLMLLVWSGCDSGQDVQEPAQEPMVEKTPGPMTEPNPSPTPGTPPTLEGTAEASGALMVVAETTGAAENNEGVNHYQQKHWDKAKEHFSNAVAANANLAEAHYNLALALDKLNNHGEATDHFKKALELAPDNQIIAGSEILKAHVGG
jgi:tetratricopeptide (TPR) repeat protein